MPDNNDELRTRQERREERLKKRREHMQKHGAGLARVYRDAVTKRLKKKETGKK